MKARIALLLALCLPFTAPVAEDGKADPGNQVAYVTLAPALVGNFGAGPRLKYFKADIALRVTGLETKSKVEHHEPLIRNQLVMLFTQQTDETLATLEAKEQLRQEALRQVQQVLLQEEGRPLVDDLLFNNLIVQ
ncbi:flagellar basal body-associated protein FliL [Zestomonas thermotolerans]|uniref:flagellar basal body-associated protein FliL n=1 Tax=Zestomonas thermotolerans TaxID=157784 RepID=UPI0023F49C17|nr:flagellar basal body-associated protein FliL [Pseudomonas thermotolerans]